jgi:hypothetical protein
MIYKKYLIPVLCLIYCSCNRDIPYINNRDSDTLKIDINGVVEYIDLSGIFTKVDYIPLETSPQCLIGSIDKMAVNGNRFFILDQQTLSVLIFDTEGRFIHKIMQVGRGPHEYETLTNFFLDVENNRIILDAVSRFLYFDLDTYAFIKEERAAVKSECAYLGNETFAYYLKNAVWNGEYNLFADRQGQVVYQHLPIPKELNGFTFSKGYNFSQPDENGDVFFIEMFHDVVYRLNADSMTVAWYIDFGKNRLPDGFFNNIPREDWGKQLVKSTYCNLVGDFVRTDHINCFNFNHNGEVISYINLYKRKEEFLFRGQNNDLSFIGDLLPIMFCDSISTYSYMEMVDLKEDYPIISQIEDQLKIFENDTIKPEQEKELSIFKNKYRAFKENYYPKLKSLAEKSYEDNPVITRWYF